MKTIEMGGRFGFRIKARRRPLYLTEPGYEEGATTPQWAVKLPHQCDSWQIADEYETTTKAEAVAALEEFIAEAQATLERLKGLPENAPDVG